MSHTKKPGFFARLFGKKPVVGTPPVASAPPFSAGQSVEFTNTVGDVLPCTINNCTQQGDGSWCCLVCFDSGEWQGKCGGVRASDLRVAGTSGSIIGAYFVGTDVLTSLHNAEDEPYQIIGHGGPPVMVPGMVYPLSAASEMLEEADVIGEVERVIGEVEHVLGHVGHHGWGGRGWGGGFGYGYPYGPPLDLGYTVNTGQAALADAALAEAIKKNTELERELAATKSKKIIGGGGGHHHGGAQGFSRGGWWGGDYPAPFAYVGPYEDVDSALQQSSADAALAEAMEQNTQLTRDLERAKLEQAARTIGGDFEDFDQRMVRFTGKMRGGR